MEKSGAIKATMDGISTGRDEAIEARQVKYLDNIVEQGHRAVKRISKSIPGIESFRAASSVLAGIELMQTIRKGQKIVPEGQELSFADQFYAPAGWTRPGDV